MNIQVFTYGTLQSPFIMKALTNRAFQGRPAILLNYAVFRVKQTKYPGIIPLKGSLVEGILYGGLDRHVLHLL
ncbi:MAG: gamma-glutamylcyclotransferase, partial [Bacteroidales bacterium]|nr:gamma-glutamylcyclotransferase [Bacteroidales bacterium]